MNLFDEGGKTYDFQVIDGGRTGILKEVLKKIDMSVCIESGIDCEFWDAHDAEEEYVISKLLNIDIRREYLREIMHEGTQSYCQSCRPRMNHINASPSGWDTCPLPEGFVITLWGREGSEPLTALNYFKVGWHDITMFQVTGTAEGYIL